MSEVNLNTFLPEMSDKDVWRLVNTMPVNYQDFAQISHLYARAYDVLTDAVEGGSADGDRTPYGVDWDEIRVNNCLREAVYRTLWTVTQDAELWAGFNFSKRYHYYEAPFPLHGKGVTPWPGVESLNTRLVCGDIPGFSEVPVNYQISPPPTLSLNETGRVIASFSATDNPNPRDVFVRKMDSGTILPEDEDIRPYPRKVGGNWQIVLNNNFVTPTEPVWGNNKKVVYVDIVMPVEGEDYPEMGEVLPVYPGTEQQIPLAAPPRLLEDGRTRWTFWVYTLVNPDFGYEKVDLIRGDFYKMLETISFKYFLEVTSPFEVVFSVGNQQSVVHASTVVVDASRGVYQILHGKDKSLCTDPCTLFTSEQMRDLKCGCSSGPDGNPVTVTIRYWYKTNPDCLNEIYRNQIPGLRQAIAYRTAAELPVRDCGCYLKVGFIAEQQTMMTPESVNPYTGIQIQRFDLGKMLGTLRYDSLMEKVTRFTSPVFLTRY